MIFTHSFNVNLFSFSPITRFTSSSSSNLQQSSVSLSTWLLPIITMWDPLSISAQIFTGEIVLGLLRKQSQKMWGVYNGMIYLSSSNLEPSPSTIDMCGITAAMDIVFAPALPQPPPSPSTLVEITMLIPRFLHKQSAW